MTEKLIVYAVLCSFYQEESIEIIFMDEKEANEYAEKNNNKYCEGRKNGAWTVSPQYVY